MMIDERMAAFIQSFDSGNSPFLETLEQEALADNVPIIRGDTQNFLKLLLAVKHVRGVVKPLAADAAAAVVFIHGPAQYRAGAVPPLYLFDLAPCVALHTGASARLRILLHYGDHPFHGVGFIVKVPRSAPLF